MLLLAPCGRSAATSVLALVLTADQHQGSSVMKLPPKECRVKYPAILP